MGNQTNYKRNRHKVLFINKRTNRIRFFRTFKFSIFIILFSCNVPTLNNDVKTLKQPFTEIKKANWLIGQWKSISSDGIAIEYWNHLNDSAMEGTSYFLKGKDTVSKETILLVQEGEKLIYIPTVSNQNQGEPIAFSCIISTDRALAFENKAHDFPQLISYKQIKADSAVAEISGPINGKTASIVFNMKKQ